MRRRGSLLEQRSKYRVAGGRDMPSGAGVQPPCGAVISWYILGGQLWKGTRIHRACAHGRSSLPETHHRCTPHPSNSPDPRLVCCQGGGLPVTLCQRTSRKTPGPDAALVLGAQASLGRGHRGQSPQASARALLSPPRAGRRVLILACAAGQGSRSH